MMSVGVLSRERVCVKILGLGARGVNGRLSRRKRTVAQNNTFSARVADAGRGRGVCRDATMPRALRTRLMARGMMTGAKKIRRDLILSSVSSESHHTYKNADTHVPNEMPTSTIVALASCEEEMKPNCQQSRAKPAD